jgi:hypothetical protein
MQHSENFHIILLVKVRGNVCVCVCVCVCVAKYKPRKIFQK